MFTYFGYGSNINITSLRAKGVEPVSSMRAVLRGWKLRFNVKHWFGHEGGVGNIEQSLNADDFVEGVVHQCPDEHLASLDAMEAYGLGYDRIIVKLETEKSTEEAWAYIGLPDALDNSCLPSQRYLNVIIKGAEAAGLSQSYIEKLRQHPVHLIPDYPDFEFSLADEVTYNEQTLATQPYLTALANAVFDMRGARRQLDCLHSLFGGKDTTLFHLKRLDTSDGSETLEDIKYGEISAAGKKYLNTCLHEYAKEFKLIGRFEYSDS